ncbi:MAG: PACE efflux transporter [Pelistega sp.]|nr:PACE efflux transporter [Pelistega sp.]
MSSKVSQVYHKSAKERFFYAFLFEILAIGISSPLAAWVFNHKLSEMGVVSVVIAIMALLLNMAYNTLFDYLLKKYKASKNTRVRILHAVGFEFTLLLMSIPFIAWYLGIGVIDALILDLGFILFYLPYTYFFNLAYDVLRAKYWRPVKEA